LLERDGKIVEVWLIPELQRLEKWWIDIEKSWLKISTEIPVIWIHNVLLDALDEKSREYAGLRPIWSTWSGISPAYCSEWKRLHFTLLTMLQNPEIYHNSIKTLWNWVRHIFPKISENDLIKYAQKEEKLIREYIKKWVIELIYDEKKYIKKLVKENKKIIWEWAQSVMISEENSYFWTASTPNLYTFLKVTWLESKHIWNIFWIFKMPPSSVWTRPTFMQFPKSKALDDFIKKYGEFGVSTGRVRDLFYHSLVETARARYIATYWLDDESKFVPVFNRVDGLECSFKMYPEEKVKIITWYKYKSRDLINENEISKITVWIDDQEITPNNARKKYPTKSQQLNLFDINSEKDIIFNNITGNTDEKIEKILKSHLAAMFKKDEEIEYIVWVWPDRNDLQLRKDKPLRVLD